jgi:hypothetical protein
LTFEPDDPMRLLAAAWIEAGTRAPVPTTPLSESDCEVPRCASRAMVFIKTRYGPIPVCREHFESVKRAVQELPGKTASNF